MTKKTSSKVDKKTTPNRLLKEQRIQHYLTQSQLAEKVGTTVVNVNRWESGVTFPTLYFRQKLCELFLKTPEKLGLVPETERQVQTAAMVSPSFPDIWNVPFQRNSFFTGREDVLDRLHKVLKSGEVAAVVQPGAITGLGGIGKTQTAVEYAYRCRRNYQVVLWIRADSREVLTSDFVALADVLDLPEKDERDQSIVINAVKRWLKENSRWLLILDNVEEIHLISDFVSPTDQGHILLTTRLQSTGDVARRIEIERMEPDEGALFLLRRAKIISPDDLLDQTSQIDRARAIELSKVMDGLPLALDQAAAYIEETGCGLTGYLKRYQTRSDVLLKKRGRSPIGHPESISTTLSISFEKVERANGAAADLLRLCAFLYPDAIPEEIITDGASDLGPTLQSVATDSIELDTAISELRRYSLLRRDGDSQTLTVHRLVQEVLKETMDEGTQEQWAERAVRAVNHVFPDVDVTTWPACQRYLPQAQACADLVEQWNMRFSEAGRLLDQAGSYLRDRAYYVQAELFLKLALTIMEQTIGPEHPKMATTYDSLAKVYLEQGKYPQAESLYQQALAIREKSFGPDHPDVAVTLETLGHLYYYQGKHEGALSLYKRSLQIRERVWGSDHVEMVDLVFSIGRIYHRMGNLDQTAAFYQRALATCEALGPEHPEVGLILDNMGMLCMDRGAYEQAEEYYQRSLATHEKLFGMVHPHIAKCLDNYALLCSILARYSQAEALAKRALTIHEQTVGPEHTDVAIVLDTLAVIYLAHGKYAQTGPILQRALTVLEKDQRPSNPLLAHIYVNLAQLAFCEGRYSDAGELYQKGLVLLEEIYGVEHPDVAETLNQMAKLFLIQGRYDQGESSCKRAITIWEKKIGPDLIDVAHGLGILARLSYKQGKHEEAEAFCKRARMIYVKFLGQRHPNVAFCLTTLAELSQARNEYSKAKSQYKQALEIWGNSVEPGHVDLVACQEEYRALNQTFV